MPAYRPGSIPVFGGVEELRRFLRDELERIAEDMATLEAATVTLNNLKAEPRDAGDGTLVYTDGVNWNPGAGAGLYLRDGGSWRKVQVA